MSKNKKQKRRKLQKKLLRLRPPEVLPDQNDFPKGNKEFDSERPRSLCPNCAQSCYNAEYIFVRTKQGPIRMYRCAQCKKIYRPHF